MAKVVGVDHLSISVRDFQASKKFYGSLLKFLGFKVLDEYDDVIGWTNGKTRLWISAANTKGKRYRFGDVGFHHYAFRLGSHGRTSIDFRPSLKRNWERGSSIARANTTQLLRRLLRGSGRDGA